MISHYTREELSEQARALTRASSPEPASRTRVVGWGITVHNGGAQLVVDYQCRAYRYGPWGSTMRETMAL